jgi:hypothetical protein
VTESEQTVETTLVDLTDIRLADLRAVALPAEQVEAVLRQVAKPKYNLGSSGPPGRAD